MKQETYYKAQELQTKITDLENAISGIGQDKQSVCCLKSLNFIFSYPEEADALEANTLKYLKAQMAKYKKQFESLK